MEKDSTEMSDVVSIVSLYADNRSLSAMGCVSKLWHKSSSNVFNARKIKKFLVSKGWERLTLEQACKGFVSNESQLVALINEYSEVEKLSYKSMKRFFGKIEELGERSGTNSNVLILLWLAEYHLDLMIIFSSKIGNVDDEFCKYLHTSV